MTDYYKDEEMLAPDETAMNKYQRQIKQGVVVDVYDVLLAFDVTCPAMQHAIKKCLAPGKRGYKNTTQDKNEAIASIKRSIELHNVI